MTAHERDVLRGLRAVRRVYRRADSLGEVLERSLRRILNRKTIPRRRAEVQGLINQYYAYEKAVTNLRDSLAKDFVSFLE